MDSETLEKCKDALTKTASKISDLEKTFKPHVVALLTTESIDNDTAYMMQKFLHSVSNDQIAVLIDSGGGDIDATAKIIKMIRNRFTKFVSIVPWYAKSAATLLAVSADDIYMTKSGELGPVDPQVHEPSSDVWIPAHSIREAMAFIEESKDNLVKLSMAEKMPPLLIGAWRDAQKASREYLEEAFQKLGEKKDGAVKLFLDKYTSHGYPIDREACTKEGVIVTCPNDEQEKLICDLHEIYYDFFYQLQKNEQLKAGGFDITIIQSASKKTISINGEDVSALV